MVVQRKLDEIIALYELEPELRDIYVEGITDKLVFERFLRKYSIKDVEVKDIIDIDFSELYESTPEIKRNNKKKLIALSKKIDEEIDGELYGISIIVDVDFDEIKGTFEKNKYLFYTDYNSIESYLINPAVIDIFYSSILRSTFPFNGEKTLEVLTPILKEKFLIRLSLKEIGNFEKDKITDLKKSVKVNKTTGSIDFNADKHLDKILNNLGHIVEKDKLVNIIEEYRLNLNDEYKSFIRGHDFVHLFFIYIDKIKNNIKLSEDMLERSLFQCLDYSELRKENLFVTIESRYKTS